MPDNVSAPARASEWWEPLLRCPCDQHSELRLDRRQSRAICESEHCPSTRRVFPIVDSQPILVDFATSILEEDATVGHGAPSLVPRPEGLRRRLGNFVFGTKAATRRQAIRFLEILMADRSDPVLLMVGGATIGYGAEPLYRAKNLKLLAFDIYRSAQTQFVADAHAIPLADASVDGAWIQAVLEHVLEPVRVVAEVHRVLKPQGLLYASTPFMQQVHEGPYDFMRFTESGHRWLFRRFARIDSGVVMGPFTALLWSIRYALAGLFRSRTAATLLCTFLFWLRYFDRLVPEGHATDGASEVYFLGRKAETLVQPREIVAAYAGAQR